MRVDQRGQGIGWEEPIPLGNPSVPHPFPTRTALPELLAELACDVDRTVMVDVTAPAVLAPVILSAAAGNVFRVCVNRAEHCEPNLSRFTLVGMLSGERKSATFRRMTRALATWRQARIANDEDAPLLDISDVTSPRLVQLMEQNGGSLAILSGDARHVIDMILGGFRRDGATDDSVFLSAHGGDVIGRSRVTDDELQVIDTPALALGLAVQPDKLAQMAARGELTSSGLVPRCNIVLPPSMVGSRIETGEETPPDATLTARWERVVHTILDYRFQVLAQDGWSPTTLRLSDESMERRRAFSNDIEKAMAEGAPLQDSREFASKAAGEAARLAALFHLALCADDQPPSRVTEPRDWTTPISEETWGWAETHQRWQLHETLRSAGLCGEPPQVKLARRLLAWAAADPVRRRTLSARDVQLARVAPKATEARDALQELEELGWARPTPPREGARAPRWELHPRVFEGRRR